MPCALFLYVLFNCCFITLFVQPLLQSLFEVTFVVPLELDISHRRLFLVGTQLPVGDAVTSVSSSWARHFTLTVPLSTRVYNGYQRILNGGGNPVMN